MQRVTGKNLNTIKPFFLAAAELAKKATCDRARCGTVIVCDGKIIGEGFNGPPPGDSTNKTCGLILDNSIKPKYDKTCCVHAEWRAIIDACKRDGVLIEGSRLYFMRIDDGDNFTDAGEPYCTTCSRLTMESGISEFALWNAQGADIYTAGEYNQKSYEHYAKTTN